MNILEIITLSSLGGAQTVLIELANELVHRGHTVTVVSNPDGEMWDLLDPIIVKVPCAYFKREISPYNDIQAIRFIKKILQTGNYDIIHLHSSKAGVWGRIAGWQFKNKILYTVHGFDTILQANRMFLVLEQMLKNHCKYLVPVSEYDRNNLLAQGIKKCRTIYNGIKDVEYPEVPNIFNLHRQGDKVIVTIARLQPPKKFDLFLNVAEQLGKEGYAFYWIGNQYEIKNLPCNTFMLGQIKDARRYLRYADLYVLFSNYEGLPVSILEAFAAGVPVVASNVGGVSEIVDGNNGIAIDNTTEAAIAAIKKVITGEIENYKSNARKTYEAKFTIEKMVNNYLDVFKECI